jgi:hypothetical protein
VCSRLTRTPVYRCTGRHGRDQHDGQRYDLHRDLRPGQLGVLQRRCACGELLPAGVVRASLLLEGFCPACNAPLHRGAAAVPEVHIPVFGASRAGKTHLVAAGVVASVALARKAATEVTFPAADAHQLFDHYSAIVAQGGSMTKTDPASAITLSLVLTAPPASSRRARLVQRARHPHGTLVHIFDAAGEAYANPERRAKFYFLDYARTLIFVLDPFSLPEIRHLYERTYEELFGRAHAATTPPEVSYTETVTSLRYRGVRTQRKRLAFVVSKADLLFQLPASRGLQPESRHVKAWLMHYGLANLVLLAEQDFQAVEYFLTSTLCASVGG